MNTPGLFMKLVCVLRRHAWDHCTCVRCGKVRDRDHDWRPVDANSCRYRCGLCGLTMFHHEWKEGKCRRCGASSPSRPYGQDSYEDRYAEFPHEYTTFIGSCDPAAHGDPRAQYNLGMMYADGIGVAKDVVQAHMWLSLSAKSGLKSANDVIVELEKAMTPPQIAEAQRLAAEFKARPERARKQLTWRVLEKGQFGGMRGMGRMGPIGPIAFPQLF